VRSSRKVTKEARRHRRLPLAGLVRLTWEDVRGEIRFTQAKCIDISEGGLRVEALSMIPAGSRVSLNAEPIKLSGGATAKHVMRYGGKYTVGLELSQAAGEKTLAPIREALDSAVRPGELFRL
jgi:hypothetical protein